LAHRRHTVRRRPRWQFPSERAQEPGRLRDRKPETTLDALMPLVANTIDKCLERTVRLRERWLEFLLGAAPRIDEYGLA
jgi:hypothetical protein